MTCRCGFSDNGEHHPCHGMMYHCRKPAKQRFYNLRPAPLAGAQMKAVAESTWACDECWERYQRIYQ